MGLLFSTSLAMTFSRCYQLSPPPPRDCPLKSFAHKRRMTKPSCQVPVSPWSRARNFAPSLQCLKFRGSRFPRIEYLGSRIDSVVSSTIVSSSTSTATSTCPSNQGESLSLIVVFRIQHFVVHEPLKITTPNQVPLLLIRLHCIPNFGRRICPDFAEN